MVSEGYDPQRGRVCEYCGRRVPFGAGIGLRSVRPAGVPHGDRWPVTLVLSGSPILPIPLGIRLPALGQMEMDGVCWQPPDWRQRCCRRAS